MEDVSQIWQITANAKMSQDLPSEGVDFPPGSWADGAPSQTRCSLYKGH